MLSITRKTGQTLVMYLPDGRTIKVIADVRKGKVRLNIAAPVDVNIWRQEMLDKNPDIAERNGAHTEAVALVPWPYIRS